MMWPSPEGNAVTGLKRVNIRMLVDYQDIIDRILNSEEDGGMMYFNISHVPELIRIHVKPGVTYIKHHLCNQILWLGGITEGGIP